MGINNKFVQAYLIDLSFPFASEERFLKNRLDKKQIHPVKKFKNAKKKVIIFSSNLKRIFGLEKFEIWFYIFLKKL